MMYPSLIGGFAFVVLFALVAFLVPVFEKIFEDFGGDLPAITKFTVWLSDMLTGRWYVMLAIVWPWCGSSASGSNRRPGTCSGTASS